MPHVVQLLLLLAAIVACAKLAGALATRVGQPAVFGEILAGLLLGPTLLDILAWPIFEHGAPPAYGPAAADLLALVRDLSEIGVVLLMFVAGMETDLGEMRRVGAVAFWSALGGVLLPLIGGAALATAFGLPLFWQGVFIGTILTATSVSISAQTLMELGQLRSPEGSTILGAAVIDDVMGIVLLSVVVAFARTSGTIDILDIGVVILRMTAFFGLAIAAKRLLPRLLRFADRLGVSQGLLGVVVIVAFLYAATAEWLGGIAAITGSYLAGVLIAQTPFKARVDAGLHPLTYSLFVPVFFIGIGLQANARALGSQATFAAALIIVAIATKAIGCGVFARLFGFSASQSVRVGVGMISRGEVGLIVAGYGLAQGIIGPDLFSTAVLMVLVTTMITPPMLRVVFPRVAVPGAPAVEETIAGPPKETHARH